jgi:hypothetical protein
VDYRKSDWGKRAVQSILARPPRYGSAAEGHPEAVVGGPEAAMDFRDIGQFDFIELIQGSLDRLDF